MGEGIEQHAEAVEFETLSDPSATLLANEERGTFTGRASVLGSIARGAKGPTRFEPGAFAESLAACGGKLPLLWQHSQADPIGVLYSVRETPGGLEVQGKVSQTARGKDLVTLMKDGAVSGLSIGFDPQVIKGFESHAATGERVRVISKARLHEVSLVTFPADKAARVEQVHRASPAAPRGKAQEAVEELLSGWPEERREFLREVLGSVVAPPRMIPRELVAELCPSCGEKMEALGWSHLSEDVLWEALAQSGGPLDLSESQIEGLCKKVGPEADGFFTRCAEMMDGKLDSPEGFCASLHKACLGSWPAEKAKKEKHYSPDQERDDKGRFSGGGGGGNDDNGPYSGGDPNEQDPDEPADANDPPGSVITGGRVVGGGHRSAANSPEAKAYVKGAASQLSREPGHKADSFKAGVSAAKAALKSGGVEALKSAIATQHMATKKADNAFRKAEKAKKPADVQNKLAGALHHAESHLNGLHAVHDAVTGSRNLDIHPDNYEEDRYSAAGPDETHVGRMFSGENLTRIKDALAALMELASKSDPQWLLAQIKAFGIEAERDLKWLDPAASEGQAEAKKCPDCGEEVPDGADHECDAADEAEGKKGKPEGMTSIEIALALAEAEARMRGAEVHYGVEAVSAQPVKPMTFDEVGRQRKERDLKWSLRGQLMDALNSILDSKLASDEQRSMAQTSINQYLAACAAQA